MICHITTRDAWEAAQSRGEFMSPEFAEIGFIHCSMPEQVVLVANAFFRGQAGRVMLVIDPARLKSQVRWEAPHSMERTPAFMHGSVFPHVYGPINLDAVTRVVPLVPGDSGMFRMERPA
ncbi:MAG TPA: DUF952 domain-containing protein [Steroidobacteraceae bacterium]|nr:DUF952 domain-containing protein [Steroidobacteraceae bacterium]